MELRQYWQIIWKRIWIPILLLIIVTGVSAFTLETPTPLYTASLRFIVGVLTEQVANQFNYNGYYAGVSSEFIADDLSVVVGSQAFIEDVNRHLIEMGSNLKIYPEAISGITFAEKQHRILELTITWDNKAELQEIGQAVIETLETDSPKYLTQLGAYGSQVVVIDRPLNPVVVPLTLIERLDLPMRLILALLAGISLTFLLDYLDTSIRNRTELEELGITVLAEIPHNKALK